MGTHADIGMIGLAVMGRNLSLNLSRNGYTVAVYERLPETLESFLKETQHETTILGTHSIAELVQTLKRPRKIMLMIRAGQPVDDVISQLLPHLEAGDIIIDGGNSHYEDTNRRVRQVEDHGCYFLGVGVSGGEEGALHGPSIMPGGSQRAWPLVKEMFQKISAKVDDTTPCCDWVGETGAGHFVKMVHNGIEYGDMQIVCEAYHLMKSLLGMTAPEIHEVFSQWKHSELAGYLIDITADIFTVQDDDGTPLVDKVLDSAQQKGTGKWVCHTALETGMPLTLINEAVYARFLSAQREERLHAAGMLSGPPITRVKESEEFLNHLRQAMYAAKIVSYAQGFSLMRSVAQRESWTLNLGEIALMWRGGCIIRSAFLNKIKNAYDTCADLTSLMLDAFFQQELSTHQTGWRTIVSLAAQNGVPIPAITSALQYYDGYRSGWLPANLLQAQRDYFGAHLFQRLDHPDGAYFHADWTGDKTRSTPAE